MVDVLDPEMFVISAVANASESYPQAGWSSFQIRRELLSIPWHLCFLLRIKWVGHSCQPTTHLLCPATVGEWLVDWRFHVYPYSSPAVKQRGPASAMSSLGQGLRWLERTEHKNKNTWGSSYRCDRKTKIIKNPWILLILVVVFTMSCFLWIFLAIRVFMPWFQEPQKLREWANNPSTRARGKCGFWGAIYGETKDRCECKGGALDLRCMTAHRGVRYFGPREFLKKYPEAQLWHAKCQCISKKERDKVLAEIREGKVEPVADSASMLNVAAVHFCSELFRKAEERFGLWSWERMEDYVQAEVNETLCREDLSDSFKEGLLGLTSSTQRALDHVCGEECEEIVNETRERSWDIAVSGTNRQGSYGELCSILVVKKVESHLLGCCGDSCGWNNRT